MAQRKLDRKRSWDATRKNAGKRLPEILSAAAKVFREKGYKEATLEDIADEVGILKGSLYYYITKKEDLLYKVVEQPLSEMTLHLRQIVQSDHSPTEKLHKALKNHIDGFKNHTEEMFVLISVEWFRSEIGGEIAELGDEYDHLFRSILAEGIQQKEFQQDLDPKLTTFAILGMYNYLQRWYAPDKGYSMDAIGDHFATLVDRAILL